MYTLERIKAAIIAEISAAAVRTGLVAQDQFPDFVLEIPNLKSHGDFATNIAMLLARPAKKPPRLIADTIAEAFNREITLVEKIQVAGPGFINFFMNRHYLHQVAAECLESGDAYGSSDLGQGKRVLVEYVSANPTGDLHVGHARGAAVGDALANILAKSGFAVEREFYINDAGNQINNLALSLEVRYRQALGQESEMPEGGYHGEDIIVFGRELAQAAGDMHLNLESHERLAFFRKYALERELAKLKQDLAEFRVSFDNWFSETTLYRDNKIQEVLTLFAEKDFTYQEGGATWFRTSSLGDDKDRVLVKNDGSYTYLLPDIAYHLNKMERGFDTLVNIWGADHHGYIPRLKAAMEALGYEREQLQILIMQLVNLFQKGEKVRMSKRTGKAVTLRDLMVEVGIDETRWFLTMLSADSSLDFDMDLAVSKSNENPVYYVQYAHARLCSIMRNAQEAGLEPEAGTDLSPLNSEREYDLLLKLAEFPGVVANAATKMAPHFITNYTFELAAQLHSFYNAERVLDMDDLPKTKARLALVKAIQVTVKNALALVGVTAPEKM